jgi:putative transposase
MAIKFRKRYRIESARLRGYDYSRDGAYFVTICAKNRKCIFGAISTIEDSNYDDVETGLRPVSTTPIIKLSEIGKIVSDCWFDLPNHYPNIILDGFIIMPNHIHGIITIHNKKQDEQIHGLPEFIRAFKSFSSRHIHENVKPNKSGIWQPRYYDHIIRTDSELNHIRCYIADNPTNWFNDRHYIV